MPLYRAARGNHLALESDAEGGVIRNPTSTTFFEETKLETWK